MNKYFIPAIALLLITAACNNADNNSTETSSGMKEVPKTHADSLMSDVMDGHNVGMSKMGKIGGMQKRVQEVLDSIAKLPSNAKATMEPFKEKMKGVLQELQSARSGMEKWMDEFNMDSAVNNMEQRINYLGEEKLKVSKVKEDILGSLQKADSLIKAKF